MTTNKYAARLTALAAGAALVAHKAVAQIVVVDVNQTAGYNPGINNHIYINPVGTEFGIGNSYGGPAGLKVDFANTFANFFINTAVVGFVGASGDATVLSAGTMIDSGSSFITGSFVDLPPTASGIYVGYSVPNQGTSNDQTWYGWVELSTNATTHNLTITRYAFDPTGAGVQAGLVSAIPEPGVSALLFGLFALGLVRVRRWRRTGGALAAAAVNA